MATTINTVVTPEQLNRVDRYFDYQKNKYFCLVENERGDTDEQGDIIRYRVEGHNGQLTCTCKAGERGVPCKHRRWVAAYMQDLRAMRQEQSLLESLVRQGYSRDEATRIAYAKPASFAAEDYRQAAVLQAQRNKGFQLMR